MFEGAAAFNQNVSEWDVANGRSFSAMFAGAVAFNQNVSKWYVANGRRFVSAHNCCIILFTIWFVVETYVS